MLNNISNQMNAKKYDEKLKSIGNLMLHTDIGLEHRGHIYQTALKRHEILHSLSRADKCTNNAHMEKFSMDENKSEPG
jgi:transposase InsO family protein